MSSSVQSRKEEILAKKAKLAELKRQRELRQREFSSNRQSVGDAAEVCLPLYYIRATLTDSTASSSLATPQPQHAVEGGH